VVLEGRVASRMIAAGMDSWWQKNGSQRGIKRERSVPGMDGLPFRRHNVGELDWMMGRSCAGPVTVSRGAMADAG
jgi:hypothetical protein